MTRDTLLLMFLLLVLYVEEGLSKRFRTFSRGRSYSGGGYSSSGSSGSGSSGDVLAIVGGIIGGCLALSVLICVCCLCYRRAKGADKTKGVVVNAPNRTRLPVNFNQANGVIISTPNGTNIPTNVNQNQAGVVISNPPPAYSEMDKPIFDIQNKVKGTQLNCSPPSNNEHVSKMGIQQHGATAPGAKVQKHKTGKSNAAFAL